MAELTVDSINARLKEILKQVDDPDLPMDEILALYEEAVKLGSKVGEVVESNISDEEARAAAEAAAAVSATTPEDSSASAPEAE